MYINDLLVTSCSPFKKHLKHLEKVLSQLNDVGLNGCTDKTVNLIGLHKPEFVCKQTDNKIMICTCAHSLNKICDNRWA